MNSVISDNRFLKVLIAAQRAKQINKGARPLVRNSNTRATRIALEEVERGLIRFEFISKDPNLKGGRDDRDISGHDDVETNRGATDRISVARALSVE